MNEESKPSKRQQKSGKVPPKATPMTFEKALEAFIQAHEAANHSGFTLRNYKRIVLAFLDYMRGEHGYTYVRQITEADIFGWLSYLRGSVSFRGRPFSSRSIETYCRDVSVFFHWLVEHKHLKVNPMARVKLPKVERALIRVFTEEELERLDTACNRPLKGASLTPDERKALGARDRAFLWLLLSTGIRVSEACGLLFSDIDWESGMIYVRGKGAKERRVPMGRVARQHLRTYIDYWRGAPVEPNEHVFLTAFGIPMRPHVAQDIFERLKRVAGITDKRVSAHTCRHWFAVNCIKNGMPSTALQALLGHEHLEMINTYVRLAEQDTRHLYDRHSPVDSLKMHRSPKGRREQAREWREELRKDRKRQK